MSELITEINKTAWGPPMLVLLLGTGLYLSLGLGFMTVRKIGPAFGLLLRGSRGSGRAILPRSVP